MKKIQKIQIFRAPRKKGHEATRRTHAKLHVLAFAAWCFWSGPASCSLEQGVGLIALTLLGVFFFRECLYWWKFSSSPSNGKTKCNDANPQNSVSTQNRKPESLKERGGLSHFRPGASKSLYVTSVTSVTGIPLEKALRDFVFAASGREAHCEALLSSDLTRLDDGIGRGDNMCC